MISHLEGKKDLRRKTILTAPKTFVSRPTIGRV
jgi:hypothetical protein